ncbi:hypothetical protein [Pseudolactococcus paracarnosus]|uniref:Uncharacterized protein n=1 Tax=Pseudolactococcus paracarnosus TaxID=2749962 RepID=A0ABT0APH4_9LACT|nr:hypothetical protein [Lactococcus paracarnosus]MCJ1978441.1 hypothetical protein [Lactococcus paracarnosus]MCJ1984580.1 hypothetical protein [Lactococcus paracarnosus]MCJ1999215.1 hypothetical protein [Lactococcus paracarnosus]
MKNKKWYVVGLVVIVMVFGLIFGINQSKAKSMNGKYDLYYPDANTYSKGIVLKIKGDKFSIPSSSDDSTITGNIDTEHHRLDGAVSIPYTYENGVFSFSGVQYIKEGSKAYKSAKEYK